jgi:hypothetical protein
MLMSRWRQTFGWTCAVLLVSVLPIACSDGGGQAKRRDPNPNQPGWHEVRLLKRTGVIYDYRPVKPEKPVEYPSEYEVNGGDARVRFAKPRASDGPDLEIEGASDRFANRIVTTLKHHGLTIASR